MLGFLNRFVDSNDRELKRIQPFIDATNELEAEFEALSDDEIRERIAEIREEIREAATPEEPDEDELEHPDLERRRELAKARHKRELDRTQKALDDVLPEVFAAARVAMQRSLGMRHFDVQLIGGVVLHQGKIAEMKTGEGKTFVPTLAAVLNALTGRGVHLVTVNDYLARRDPQWMGPVYHFLGLSVGMITHDASFVFEPGYPTSDERLINLKPVTRQEAYAADITYGTNNEFGFDYLRDNMVTELDQRVQRERAFAIVDEVDNILIDEARTPLIISGQAEESADKYYSFARLVPRLQARAEGAEEGGDYFVDLKDKAVSPTEQGIEKMERMLGVPNLYDTDPTLARHFEQALRAHALFKRDRDYLVKDGEIVIVDEFTGRQMPGRRWSEGLHQAIEAKEGLRVQRESVTLATITFQNYFRLYDKLSGMTGTAMTEAEEFHKIYNLEVVAIPTHRPMVRQDDADLVYRNEKGKFEALIDEIIEMTEAGRPVLVGTVSVEKSEILSEMLKRRGIRHEVLNAKFHDKEAPIVAQAGRTGAVTIATNMAGRGTDIQLGGNPAGLASDILHRQGLNPAEVDRATYDAALAEAKAICDGDHERVVAVGGLHIIGTERHESRRIDNQLRGRAGRQGDPGSSRFYLSLEDALLRIFAGDRIKAIMERLKMPEGEPIEHAIVTRSIESAQRKVEAHNFDIRKQLLEYDNVANDQRKTVYELRNQILDQESAWSTVRSFRTVLTAPTGLTSADATLTTRPKFEWATYGGVAPNPTNYTIQVSTASSFATTVVNATASGTAYTPTVDLPKGVTLYWRLRANGANGPSLWADGGSWLSANPPSVPGLLSPAAGALTTDLSPTLDWSDSVPGLDHYQVQIATDAGFVTIVRDENVGASTYTVSPDLDPNATYWWRVRSWNASLQYSLWSTVRTFREALTAPVLLTPGHGSVVTSLRPTLDWVEGAGPAPLPTNYTLQVSTNGSFTTFVINVTVSTSQYTPTVNLPTGKTLDWRVRSNGVNGPSAWSVVSSFVIIP